MKRMTLDEWQAYMKKRRESFEEVGITDINEVRATRMWNDPFVKVEDIPSQRFVFDATLGQFVLPDDEDKLENPHFDC
jgi:8-oxo-dGTP pyrophosphatase MutT (NUDIX family)